MCLLVLSLLTQVAEPSLEQAFSHDAIRGAAQSGLCQRSIELAEFEPLEVEFLSFRERSYATDPTLPLDLLLPFSALRSLRVEKMSLMHVQVLREFSSFHELVLWSAVIPDVTELPTMSCLTHLTMRCMDLTSPALSFLSSCPSLTSIDLRNNRLESLKIFFGLPQLHRLDLRDNPVAPEKIAEFKARRPDVQVLFGPHNHPDEYIRRMWISNWGAFTSECMEDCISARQNGPWKDRLPWVGESERFLRILMEAGEVDYFSGMAAVIVRYAQFFREEGQSKYLFSLQDPFFAWFLDYTGMPPNADGVYPLDHVVQWIGEHKDSDLLPPSLLLDDMLALWFDTDAT
jgi:hypothetical protein